MIYIPNSGKKNPNTSAQHGRHMYNNIFTLRTDVLLCWIIISLLLDMVYLPVYVPWSICWHCGIHLFSYCWNYAYSVRTIYLYIFIYHHVYLNVFDWNPRSIPRELQVPHKSQRDTNYCSRMIKRVFLKGRYCYHIFRCRAIYVVTQPVFNTLILRLSC